MTSEAIPERETPRRVLDEILANKRAENETRYHRQSHNPFLEIFLDSEWPAVIAEIKPKSPSAGKLTDDPRKLVKQYEAGGAKAISVLTDKKYFGGSPELFVQVRDRTGLPMLWKDFVIDPNQILDAEARGANAVLLIVTALKRENVNLKAMIDFSRALRLAPVVEVYDEQELVEALNAGAQIIGVNSRNLDNLYENPEQALEVLKQVPNDKIALLFSSIKSRDDVEKAKLAGAKGVLVGTSILTAPDPVKKLRELTSV